MKKRRLARQIVPWLGLYRGVSHFRCPHCDKTWERGGHKEGFVKAAASTHVFQCWEILLFQAGYYRGDYMKGGELAEPISKLDGSQPWHRRWRRGIVASIARRRRAGYLPHA